MSDCSLSNVGRIAPDIHFYKYKHGPSFQETHQSLRRQFFLHVFFIMGKKKFK